MPDFPEVIDNPTFASITPGSSIPEFAYFGTYGSRAFPVANKALFYPFTVDEYVTAYQMSWITGNTAPSNGDLGIYDLAGNRLVSSGTIAGAGASAIQVADITDTPLKPGYYFMAIVFDAITGALFASACPAIPLASWGVCEMTSAFNLPTTATYTKMTSAYVPAIAVHLKATV